MEQLKTFLKKRRRPAEINVAHLWELNRLDLYITIYGIVLRGILTLVTLHSEAVVGTASLQEGIKVSSDSFARVSRRKKKLFFHVEPVSKLSCKVVFSFSISLHQVLL